jgi:hypothetical protein
MLKYRTNYAYETGRAEEREKTKLGLFRFRPIKITLCAGQCSWE